jgi:energy-coupling factor transport system permease protein
MRRAALAYSPGSSPLHRASPQAAIAYLGAFALVAFVYSSPLVLLAAGAALATTGTAAGAGRAVRGALKLALPLIALMVVINGLLYHRGDTVLVRGWELPVLGRTDVTLESLAAGGAIGLRVLVVLLAFSVYSACVDPDRVLRLLRPLARRSALTVALVNRMIPVAVADLVRLREAASLRGPGASPVGRAALARRLVAGSLDRAVDLAATLELRGHGLDRPAATGRDRPRPRQESLLLASAISTAVLAVTARLADAGSFETYPRIELATEPPTLALCAAIAVLAALPFAPRWPGRAISRLGQGRRRPGGARA